MQILESDALFNFNNSLGNEQTRHKYQMHIKRFLKDASIVEFLQSPDVEHKIIKYLVEMRTQKLSHSYINLAFAAIKHLCFMNDVVINTKKISKFVGERTELKPDRPYSAEEIQKLLSIADLRLKVIVLLLSSTGMRIGALPMLRVLDIPYGKDKDKDNSQTQTQEYTKRNDYNSDKSRVVVYAKTAQKYITFMTPECRQAIQNYLEFRRRSGEKITEDSFLLREKFDMNDLEQVRKRTKQVTIRGIATELRRALVKCGLRQIDHTSEKGKARHEVKLANGFRKFFTNALIEADIKTEHRWLLEGHNLKANDDYYVRTSEKALYEAYQKAENLLTIDPANRLQKKVQKYEEEGELIRRLGSMLRQAEEKGLTLDKIFPT